MFTLLRVEALFGVEGDDEGVGEFVENFCEELTGVVDGGLAADEDTPRFRVTTGGVRFAIAHFRFCELRAERFFELLGARFVSERGDLNREVTIACVGARRIDDGDANFCDAVANEIDVARGGAEPAERGKRLRRARLVADDVPEMVLVSGHEPVRSSP